MVPSRSICGIKKRATIRSSLRNGFFRLSFTWSSRPFTPLALFGIHAERRALQGPPPRRVCVQLPVHQIRSTKSADPTITPPRPASCTAGLSRRGNTGRHSWQGNRFAILVIRSPLSPCRMAASRSINCTRDNVETAQSSIRNRQGQLERLAVHQLHDPAPHQIRWTESAWQPHRDAPERQLLLERPDVGNAK